MAVTKFQNLAEIYNLGITNYAIFKSFLVTWQKIADGTYDRILCSISGGSDSDIMLDLIYRCDINERVDYVWFDTGLEYQATERHLEYLEYKYNIQIKRYSAQKPIPIVCRDFGQPFVSKIVSEQINTLQRHDFKWEDRPYEELAKEYPLCLSAIKWWCNYVPEGKKAMGCYMISYNKGLKEFLVKNPPTFPIANKCCWYSKKLVSKELMSEMDYQLKLTGVRKAEGGVRSAAYQNCFTSNDDGHDDYRPIFWYSNDDKKEYELLFGIKHSDCYGPDWGFKRTGCCGCPYNRELFDVLAVIARNEPKLYRAVTNVFSDTYAYTKKYRDFRSTLI